MIDTHVHLQSDAYAEDIDAVIQHAVESGVTTCIIPGTNLSDSYAAVALTERSDIFYAAVGFHPTNAQTLTPETLAELRELAQHPRVVAIGEIGLDYYWPHIPNRDWPCADPATQREALEIQLALAADLELPVIIHDRDAHEDVLHILEDWITDASTSSGESVSPGEKKRGTLHCYAGGPTLLTRALRTGFYIGMDGPVTFKKSHSLHQVAKRVPVDRLLLETDAPYLTPVPHRGERNEPAYLTYIAQRIAELRDVPTREISRATTENARRLFKKLLK
jgi:TatD DNase family protein